MNKKKSLKSLISVTTLAYVFLLSGLLATVNSCQKSTTKTTINTPIGICGTVTPTGTETTPLKQNEPQTFVVSIAAVKKVDATTEVMFHQLQEIFTVPDAALITALQTAYNATQPVKVTVDPWKGIVTGVTAPSADEITKLNARHASTNESNPVAIDLNTVEADALNNVGTSNLNQGLKGINTTTGGLTAMIPDMATALLMFNYITKQCCALSGPYSIDHCISFQYCQDGCYARAHKMCWIMNNKFNYATQKIFSFANSGSDQLSVQGQKWGGCCVRWWYHVAPFVTIKTPTGPKAYVFDPAMFDHPVLLSDWLHAQENPACAASGRHPHVTMINVQPTASYSPATYSGTSFDTDPFYYDTNSTMTSYSTLNTCP